MRRAAVAVFHQTVATHAKQAAGVDASNPDLMIGVQLAERGFVVLCPRCYIFDDGTDYPKLCHQQQVEQERSLETFVQVYQLINQG